MHVTMIMSLFSGLLLSSSGLAGHGPVERFYAWQFHEDVYRAVHLPEDPVADASSRWLRETSTCGSVREPVIVNQFILLATYCDGVPDTALLNEDWGALLEVDQSTYECFHEMRFALLSARPHECFESNPSH